MIKIGLLSPKDWDHSWKVHIELSLQECFNNQVCVSPSAFAILLSLPDIGFIVMGACVQNFWYDHFFVSLILEDFKRALIDRDVHDLFEFFYMGIKLWLFQILVIWP